ncbi:MAG: heme exporter protein CcmD [Sphingomonas sp.]|nr:heme exporter protein CcmD [Sphingomonas sp.]
MNQWAFVIAAYAVTITAVAVLILWSYASMRRAEATADKLRR